MEAGSLGTKIAHLNVSRLLLARLGWGGVGAPCCLCGVGPGLLSLRVLELNVRQSRPDSLAEVYVPSKRGPFTAYCVHLVSGVS